MKFICTFASDKQEDGQKANVQGVSMCTTQVYTNAPVLESSDLFAASRAGEWDGSEVASRMTTKTKNITKWEQ